MLKLGHTLFRDVNSITGGQDAGKLQVTSDLLKPDRLRFRSGGERHYGIVLDPAQGELISSRKPSSPMFFGNLTVVTRANRVRDLPKFSHGKFLERWSARLSYGCQLRIQFFP